jgi:hypothetical protein
MRTKHTLDLWIVSTRLLGTIAVPTHERIAVARNRSHLNLFFAYLAFCSNEGLAGFYKGFTVSIYRLVLSSSLFFVMLEQNKQFFLDYKTFRDEIQVDNDSSKLIPSISPSNSSVSNEKSE